ncbi:multifunctional CCA addition/repair protein [Thalassotalea aquiviva]|uniref:multifunctional CCA addition/repair protein n=1 Tax=Thalassotalea aquiviva TaxID=3242415 RepID=UPI00352A29D5
MAKQSTLLSSLNIFLVGGAVRDSLLNRPILERDYLVVGASAEQMLARGFKQVGKDFPVFLHPKTKEEYALARTERKQGNGYTGFVCYAEPDVTIEQDLMRRDLTINAMAMSPAGDIIDPYNGQTDLNNRVLRHVSDAFKEDPLRVLRVARFAARYHYLGFEVAEETMQLMSHMVEQGELQALTPDRVWKEFSRALMEDNPEIFIEVLRHCSALKVLWPSLDALWGIPNPKEHHPEVDSGVHTLLVLQQAVTLKAGLDVRFASLCHDLGKGLTDKSQWPKHFGHEKSGLVLVNEICQQLRVPNQITRVAQLTCEFHLHCHRAFELRAETILTLFNKVDVWRKESDFDSFLLACQADACGRLGMENNPYPQAQYLRECLQACKHLKPADFVAKGLKGKAIKEAINHTKVDAIAKVKSRWQEDNAKSAEC